MIVLILLEESGWGREEGLQLVLGASCLTVSITQHFRGRGAKNSDTTDTPGGWLEEGEDSAGSFGCFLFDCFHHFAFLITSSYHAVQSVAFEVKIFTRVRGRFSPQEESKPSEEETKEENHHSGCFNSR